MWLIDYYLYVTFVSQISVLFLRELYADILSAEGLKVETAEDGEVALEKMKDTSRKFFEVYYQYL